MRDQKAYPIGLLSFECSSPYSSLSFANPIQAVFSRLGVTL
jgi:hypothetical protein